MSEIIDQIGEIQREVGTGKIPAGEANVVRLRRTYQAEIEDVWDAVTDPARIGRWFLPVTGDLRLGGKYQLKGNAGGEILRCEPPKLLKVTWIYGENPTEKDVSEVVVRLSQGKEGQTVFELEHSAAVDPQMWGQFGPGAVGVGWDLGLLGLSLHLRGGAIEDPAAWEASAEAREFSTRSSKAWGKAFLASGASSDEVAAAVENTTNFYAPPLDS
ncbi:MAG TPA: polyketide cyclase [Micromonosporaceae bacterium]|nr:polyketide cyclase [Micromonosporaceae bacterium]HCU52473.1 polyketide cyclase [Micromonosporaceae bacterium]